jgi:hypothetical protein
LLQIQQLFEKQKLFLENVILFSKSKSRSSRTSFTFPKGTLLRLPMEKLRLQFWGLVLKGAGRLHCQVQGRSRSCGLPQPFIEIS